MHRLELLRLAKKITGPAGLDEHFADDMCPGSIHIPNESLTLTERQELLIGLAKLALKSPKACGKLECSVSTGIHEGPTFGSGKLDEHGFWEHPCDTCAREWEEIYPEDQAWPFKKGKE